MHEVVRAAKAFLVWVARIVLYPVHAAYRICVRLLALLAVSSSILLGLTLPIGFVLLVVYMMPDFRLPDWSRGVEVLRIAAVLTSLGILGTLLTSFGKEAWNRWVEICRKIAEVCRGRWLPEWQIRESVASTRDYLRRVPNHRRESFRSSGKLTAVILAMMGVVWLVWLSEAKPPNSTVRYVAAPVEAYVAVVAAANVEEEEVRDHMQAGMAFALIHPENGQGSGEGICLEESHQGFLNTLKNAIVGCIKSGIEDKEDWAQQPTFEVAGFASISPAKAGNVGGENASEIVNCEFANRRAHAVAAFLVDGEAAPKGKWHCDHVGKDLASAKSLCAASEKQD